MRYRQACIAFALGLSAATAAWGQSIRGVGDLPGGVFGSRAYGVSADGGVVVGESATGPFSTAFRWTAAGGIRHRHPPGPTGQRRPGRERRRLDDRRARIWAVAAGQGVPLDANHRYAVPRRPPGRRRRQPRVLDQLRRLGRHRHRRFDAGAPGVSLDAGRRHSAARRPARRHLRQLRPEGQQRRVHHRRLQRSSRHARQEAFRWTNAAACRAGDRPGPTVQRGVRRQPRRLGHRRRQL